MTILVTGGDGRVGKELVKRLLKLGLRVRMFCHHQKKIKHHKNLEVYYGDIRNKSDLEKCMTDIDLVYHLAAILDYSTPKKIMREVNVEGTKNLLEAARGKRVIFMSSSAVMGKKLAKLPADEKTYCKPTNVYGQTKKDAETLAKKAGAVTIRPTIVYGNAFESGFFEIFDLVKNKKIYIIGDGKNKIQFVHINDLVDALLLAKDKGRPGQVYIISGDDIRTQEEVLQMVADHLKIKLRRKHLPLEVAKFLIRIKSIKDGSKKRYIMEEGLQVLSANRIFDISKARLELGFNPKVKYEQGIPEVVEAYKKKRGLN